MSKALKKFLVLNLCVGVTFFSRKFYLVSHIFHWKILALNSLRIEDHYKYPVWEKFKHWHWHEKFVIKSLLFGDHQMQDKWSSIMLSFYHLTTVIWELGRAPQLEKERCIFIIMVICYSGAVPTKVHTQILVMLY